MQKKDEEFGRPTGDIPDESDLDNSNYLAKIKKENSYYDYSLGESNQGNDDSSVFAVGPSDPRYFQGFSNPIIGEEAENPHKESLSKMKTLETTSKVWGQSTGDVAVASEVHQVPVANLIEEENKADLYFTGTHNTFIVLLVNKSKDKLSGSRKTDLILKKIKVN